MAKNICPHCSNREPLSSFHCRKCGTTLLVSSQGAVSFWLLGEIELREANELARQVGMALGVPVVIQPGRLDPKPSERPHWNGRSGNVVLNQLSRRDTPGTLTNVALVADNITYGAGAEWIFGYAYTGWPASCLSFHPLKWDTPDFPTFIHRARSVCLHEIGHNLDLPDHAYNGSIDCCMVGGIPDVGRGSMASYPSTFCQPCLKLAKERLRAFAEERTGMFKPQPGVSFTNRYELVDRAGEGGMGSVWKARDHQMKQDVALKFVAGSRFNGGAQVFLQEEAAKVRRLAHPNIIRVFDLVRDGGVGAVVMDWMPGSDLDNLRRQQPDGFFDHGALTAWVDQLCSALAYTHRQGLIHQDLKPGNCLIDKTGHLILADFGLSRVPVTGVGGSGDTRVFHTRGKGTPGFSAPEQFAGAPPVVTHDVYAFGATLYRLLTGVVPREGLPFRARQPAPPCLQILRARRNPLRPAVPDTWLSIIRECLNLNPSARPQSMEEIAQRLSAGQPHTVSLASAPIPVQTIMSESSAKSSSPLLFTSPAPPVPKTHFQFRLGRWRFVVQS